MYHVIAWNLLCHFNDRIKKKKLQYQIVDNQNCTNMSKCVGNTLSVADLVKSKLLHDRDHCWTNKCFGNWYFCIRYIVKNNRTEER